MTLRELIVEKFLEEARKEIREGASIEDYHPTIRHGKESDVRSASTIEWMKRLLERALVEAEKRDRDGAVRFCLGDDVRTGRKGRR